MPTTYPNISTISNMLGKKKIYSTDDPDVFIVAEITTTEIRKSELQAKRKILVDLRNSMLGEKYKADVAARDAAVIQQQIDDLDSIIK